MGRDENRAYLEAIRSRYRHAGLAGKFKILDEFCTVCGLSAQICHSLAGYSTQAVPPALGVKNGSRLQR